MEICETDDTGVEFVDVNKWKDYSKRQGLTRKPLTKEDMCKVFGEILHLWCLMLLLTLASSISIINILTALIIFQDFETTNISYNSLRINIINNERLMNGEADVYRNLLIRS